MGGDSRLDELLSVWDAAEVKPSLEDLCQSTPELLEPMRRRIAALQAADLLLNTDILNKADTTKPLHHPPGRDPEQICQYRILGKIGEGGMGVVYRAEQREPVRRVVALKLIKLGMDTHEVVARFEAERQALALMNHPNVAKVLEAGISETGRPYFAMELVQGIDFTRYCEDEKLPIRQRLELFVPVCQAVQHAHQKGIIHRDLKPSNILVQLIDGKPIPKVIDFGIAKATNQVLTQNTLFTKTGAMIGTPEYMSPEQAMTSGLDVDTRTDIYSLGVILYQLLTGTLPLDPKVLREAGLEGMARLIKNQEPPRPSTRLLTVAGTAAADSTSSQARDTKLRHRELQKDLDWIVLKAMEKDRARRYETANALAVDIQRHLDGETVLARPPSTAYRMQKFVGKHRLVVGAGIAIAAALVAGVLLFMMEYLVARHERDVTQAANSKLVEEKERADRATTTADSERRRAEDQKNLATTNERKAQLRLAEGLASQGNTMLMSERIAEARGLYLDSIAEFNKVGASPFRGEVGLTLQFMKSPPPLLRLAGHRDTVNSVAFSADGRYVISGSQDLTLRRWDLQSGDTRTLASASEFIKSVGFGRSSSSGYSFEMPGVLRRLNLDNGRENGPRLTVLANAAAATFSSDGRHAILLNTAGNAEMWDLENGAKLTTWNGLPEDITCAAISSDGQRALFGTTTGTAELWKVGETTRSASFPCADAIHSVAFSPRGSLALLGCGDHGLQLLDLTTGRVIRWFQGHTGNVNCVAFSPDGTLALSGGDDHTVNLWDVDTGLELNTFQGHSQRVNTVAFSPDGSMALSGGADFNIFLWPVSARPWADFSKSPALAVAVSNDGTLALSGHTDGTATLWDTHTGNALRSFVVSNDSVDCVAIGSDNSTLLTGGSAGTLLVWDVNEKHAIRAIGAGEESFYSVALSPNCKMALTGGSSTVKLWDIKSGALVSLSREHQSDVKAVAFLPNNPRYAVSGDSHGILILHDLEHLGQPGSNFHGTHSLIHSLAVSPDGKTVLTANEDSRLRLWDIETFQEIDRSFRGHRYGVTSVAFRKDGHTAFSGSADNTVRMWDVDTGKEIQIIAREPGTVSSVAFSADDRTLIAVSDQGSADSKYGIKIWDFDQGLNSISLENGVPALISSADSKAFDPAKLKSRGRWFGFLRKYDWAIQTLGQSPDISAYSDQITLAECYWGMSRDVHKSSAASLECLNAAKAAFGVGMRSTTIESEKSYAKLRLAAVEHEIDDATSTAQPAENGALR